MRGERITALLVLAIILFIMGSNFALTQQDSDGDGVLDEVDKCKSTNLDEGLPIAQNKEYLGCSCSQIQEILGDYYCYDVLCSPNRPFSIRERTYSSRTVNCSQDYCKNNTLYDFPNTTQLKCVDGKEEKLNCVATIIENAQACINGSIEQYSIVSIEPKHLGLILLDDYEKLQNRAYILATSDPRIKSGLGISNADIFAVQTKKTMNSIIIEKSSKTEIKTFGSSERSIKTNTLKLSDESYKKVKKLYVFEELPRGAKIQSSDIIPTPEVLFQEEGPIILVWELEALDGSAELIYQVNKPFDGETNTLLIAKEVKDTTWKLLFIPLSLIILIVGIFLYVSEKSVPKRKKIFKER